MESPHDAATAYNDAAVCYKKTNSAQAVLLYKEVPSSTPNRCRIAPLRTHRAPPLLRPRRTLHVFPTCASLHLRAWLLPPS